LGHDQHTPDRSRPALAALDRAVTRKVTVISATNMSRTEIARELYLSVNTVNTHVRNIYAKLDARDRSTAVARARELRLIASSSVAH
jgi:LuxR family maltose regulon positive regulatory protein